MFRPPRPPTSAKQSESLHPLPTNPARPTRLIQMAITRFNSQDSGRSGSLSKAPHVKRTDTGDSQERDSNVLVTPKYSLQIGELGNKNWNKTLSVNPGSFKIRYLSSQGSKRSKQNLEPNFNTVLPTNNSKDDKIGDHIRSIEIKDKAKSTLKSARNVIKKQIMMKMDKMVRNLDEQRFYAAVSKTCVIRLGQQLVTTSEFCVIISQSLFQDSITSQSTLAQLKTLTKSLSSLPKPLSIVLKLSTPTNALPLKPLLQAHSLPITHLLFTSQKSISSTHILNLQKIPSKNYLIFNDLYQYGIDIYANGKQETLYGYWKGDIQGVYQFLDQAKFGEEGKVEYNGNCGLVNFTGEVLENRQILEKIKLKERQPSLKSIEIITPKSPKTHKKQFDQQYRQKMITYTKLLHSQHQPQSKPPRNPSPYYSSAYSTSISTSIQINLPISITTIMETYITGNTTAYQIVSELCRNNIQNCEQIGQWRNRCAGLRAIL